MRVIHALPLLLANMALMSALLLLFTISTAVASPTPEDPPLQRGCRSFSGCTCGYEEPGCNFGLVCNMPTNDERNKEANRCMTPEDCCANKLKNLVGDHKIIVGCRGGGGEIGEQECRDLMGLY